MVRFGIIRTDVVLFWWSQRLIVPLSLSRRGVLLWKLSSLLFRQIRHGRWFRVLLVLTLSAASGFSKPSSVLMVLLTNIRRAWWLVASHNSTVLTIMIPSVRWLNQSLFAWFFFLLSLEDGVFVRLM